MEKYNLDLEAFCSLHLFGDILEQAISSLNTPEYILTPAQKANDAIGKHWYGIRCHFIDLINGNKFWLHVGMIYLPETRSGLMVEVDQKNNRENYECIWKNIQSGSMYEVSKEESEYLKLFMRNDDFELLCNETQEKQKALIAVFVAECAKSIAASAR